MSEMIRSTSKNNEQSLSPWRFRFECGISVILVYGLLVMYFRDVVLLHSKAMRIKCMEHASAYVRAMLDPSLLWRWKSNTRYVTRCCCIAAL